MRTSGMLPARCLVPFLLSAAIPGMTVAVDDPLPSWNEGPAKQTIMDFVAHVTAQGGADEEALRQMSRRLTRSAVWQAGSPPVTSTDCRKSAWASRGSACPSRNATARFRNEPP